MSRPDHAAPPLVLGATGRLGRAFRMLWANRLWPGTAEPLWQGRRAADLTGNALVWDLLTQNLHDDPRLDRTSGIVVLAGVTTGSPDMLADNSALALAALELARARRLGPVLLMSSAAVYGRAVGPQAETGTPVPAGAYGAAKLAMERAVAARLAEMGDDAPAATCLRLGNVAGSDALFGAAAKAALAGRAVPLDRFADGSGPRRAYVGPRTLADVLLRLIAAQRAGTALPAVLNLASPGTVAMADILTEAGADWHWQVAPATALPEMALDTCRLSSILPPLAPVDAGSLVAEARAAGWEGAR